MKDFVNARIDRDVWNAICEAAQRETRSATAQLDVTLRSALRAAWDMPDDAKGQKQLDT